MRSTRKLQVRRERLVELGPEQLGDVAGATRYDSCHITFYPCPTDVDCPTIPLDHCFAASGGGCL